MSQQREEIIAREEMLKKIRQALLISTDFPFGEDDKNLEVFAKTEDISELFFAQQLIEAGGKFVYCENVRDFHKQFTKLIEKNKWKKLRTGDETIAKLLKIPDEFVLSPELCTGEEVSITQCEYLAARSGSIIISTNVCPDRLAWSFCSVLIVIASVKQVVDNITTAYKLLKEKYKDKYPSMISVITGPSRTSDIEKHLVMGAHGPSQIYVFLIDVNPNE